MRILQRPIQAAGLILLVGVAATARAQVTYSDDFSAPVNYLTNGVAGTIWDGIYLGAGDIANSTGVGAAAGSVSVADSDISGNNLLTLASVQTDWENTADDGVFLFKVVTGDFDMSVHVLGPIDTGAYNLPGLMVRAFGPGGSPSPNNAENSLVWARFDEFNIANMQKNNVNGAKTDTPRGTYPNSNYWLRIQRIGSTLNLYEKALETDSWISVGSVTRTDFNGLPLQVGIEHADFGGGTTRAAQYEKFSLSVSNLTSSPVPSPPSGLTLAPHTNLTADISWTPGAASNGSVVVVWTGGSAVKQAPANGFSYSGNATFGSGDTLPATNYYVVYSGSGSSVTVSNLASGATYNVAVFASAGAGSSLTYNHSPATGMFITAGPVANQLGSVQVDPASPALTNYTGLGEWNTDGNFENWSTSQISGAAVAGGILSGTASGSNPQVSLLNFANGPDLDLAFNDYIDLRLQVPTGFAGSIQLYYGVTNTPGISSARVFTIANSSIPQDGAFHVYRIFIGPQPYWRGNLRDVRLDPLGASAIAGQSFAIDYVRVGDLAGDIYYPRYSPNCPAPGQLDNHDGLQLPVMDMDSKHFRVLWDASATSNSFWRANLPHGTLRNLEECWKTHIWYLGYREPSQSWIPANRDGKKYKVNLTMFYGGYWSGGDGNTGFGWLNITPDGLRVDPPTWVPPHEFGHVIQMHQEDGGQNMLGDWWESHANYVRERWIYYYAPYLPGWTDAQSGLDPYFADTSHFYCSHGRHYYLCWPLYLYLDENPDHLPDLGEGFVVKLWQNVQPGEYIYSTIQRFATHTSLKDIIGYYARRNVMWDYSHRGALQAAARTGDADLNARWTYAELRQRPDDPSWWQVPPEMAPMQGAYKIHQLIPQGSGAGRVVTVNFHGLPNVARGADWRASLVVVSDGGAVRYSSLWNAGTNSVTLAADENTLYLVVAGTPNQFLYGSFDDTVYPYQLSNPSNPNQVLSQQRTRFPYEVQLFGAVPKESNNGSTAGLVQVPNGGGWRSSTALVDATAYVGPNARVLGSAQVRNSARVEDYAVVKDSARVLGSAVVSGHALVRNTAVVTGNAKVRDYAMIIDNSIVADSARVLQHGEVTGGSTVSNWATIKGCASTWKDTSVAPNQVAGNDAVLDGDFSTARIVTNGFQFGFLPYNPGPQNWISARTAPRRLYADYEFTRADDSLARDFYGVTDGYLEGGPIWYSSDGQRTGFLSFNGTNQYVLLDPSVSDLREITVAAWIKWSGGASNQPVWHFGCATNRCMFLTPDDGSGHTAFVIRNGGLNQTLVARAALVTGVWAHVAVTLSNGVTGRLYVNGVLQQQGSITIAPDQLNAGDTNTAAQYNYLARSADASQPLFHGAVDGVRIYTGPLTDSEISSLNPANRPPVFAGISNFVIGAGVVLTVTNAATDPDQPWQTLRYSLVTGPDGAALDPDTGVLIWRPAVSQANTTNALSVEVADNGMPSLSATQDFSIVIKPLAEPEFNAISVVNGQITMRVSGDVGPDYSIQSSTNLADWATIFITNSPALPLDWTDPEGADRPLRFYRVLLGP